MRNPPVKKPQPKGNAGKKNVSNLPKYMMPKPKGKGKKKGC